MIAENAITYVVTITMFHLDMVNDSRVNLIMHLDMVNDSRLATVMQ